MPDNHTNLPILDDIIKPGDTDKAAHQPARKAQRSSWSDKDRNDTSTAGTDAEANAVPATDAPPDSSVLITNDQSVIDATDRTEALENANETRAPAIELPDLDALTEEILENMMLEVEQQLRDKIRQTLSRHFSGKAVSD
jgi:hypothetical protein